MKYTPIKIHIMYKDEDAQEVSEPFKTPRDAIYALQNWILSSDFMSGEVEYVEDRVIHSASEPLDEYSEELEDHKAFQNYLEILDETY